MDYFKVILSTVVICLSVLIVFWMLGGIITNVANHFPQLVVTKMKDAPTCGIDGLTLGKQVMVGKEVWTIDSYNKYESLQEIDIRIDK